MGMKVMTERNVWKRNSAKRAAELVNDDMFVGLGSGSTLAEVVKELGERNSGAMFAAASTSTQRMAERMDLNVSSLGKDTELDLAIDGSDEVDPNFDMIKGGGGCHTREKIVASAAKKVAIVVDETKLVDALGSTHPVPVEIIPFAKDYTAGLLEKFGDKVKLRKSSSGGPFVTDNGNYVLDVEMEGVSDPPELERDLNEVPGIIENGVFADVADEIYVGYEGGCEVFEAEEDFDDFVGRRDCSS